MSYQTTKDSGDAGVTFGVLMGAADYEAQRESDEEAAYKAWMDTLLVDFVTGAVMAALLLFVLIDSGEYARIIR